MTADCSRLEQFPARKRILFPRGHSSIRQTLLEPFDETNLVLYFLWIRSYIHFGVGWCFLLVWSEMLGMPHLYLEGLQVLSVSD